MGLASALSTALTGMAAAETTIDVVGNNIANANTVGFKSSEAVFATQFLQTQGLGSAPSTNRGGTNPRQIGLGTKVAEITPDFNQGTIEISSNPSDLAIQGDGFFVVRSSTGENLYTRNGLFKTNSQNELVTITGQRLLGFGVNDDFEIEATLEPLTIPLGSAAVAQPTENVFLEGTLPPNGDVADTPGIIQSSFFSDGTKEDPAAVAAGDVTTLLGVDTSATTTTGAVVGGGGLAAGEQYNYIVTFLDAEGNESAPSAPTASVTLGAGDNSVDLAGIPSVIPAGFTERLLYRSANGGSGPYTLIEQTATPAAATNDDGSDLGPPPLDGNTLALGSYSYHVTFGSSITTLESRPTPLIGPVSVNSPGQKIRLTNLPQPLSADFDQIKVYRSLSDDDSTFYEIATLASGSTTYIDNAQDVDIVANPELNLEGPPITLGLELVNVVQRNGSTYDTPFEVGTLHFTGRKGGRTLETKDLQITPTTTVQNLIDFMNQALGIHTDAAIPGSPGGGLSAGTTSALEFVSNGGVDNAVEIGLSGLQMETATGTTNLSLGFSTTQEAIGESAVTDFVVFDSLGVPLNVRLTMALESRTSSNTVYRWFADSPDNAPLTGNDITVGSGTITFDGEGGLVGNPNAVASIERTDIASASPLEFELDFSRVSGLAADRASISASRQDGSSAGTLTSFLIGEDGTIRGVFSNGVTRDLGQIRLARFANSTGLEQRGENLFAEGVNSGLPIPGNPGEQGIGTIIAGAVELSNTDVGQNLIDLILASTQYRGGTRVITAVQQLFDELLALRR